MRGVRRKTRRPAALGFARGILARHRPLARPRPVARLGSPFSWVHPLLARGGRPAGAGAGRLLRTVVRQEHTRRDTVRTVQTVQTVQTVRTLQTLRETRTVVVPGRVGPHPPAPSPGPPEPSRPGRGGDLRVPGVSGRVAVLAAAGGVGRRAARFGHGGGAIGTWKVGDAPRFRDPVRFSMTDRGVSTRTSAGIETRLSTAYRHVETARSVYTNLTGSRNSGPSLLSVTTIVPGAHHNGPTLRFEGVPCTPTEIQTRIQPRIPTAYRHVETAQSVYTNLTGSRGSGPSLLSVTTIVPGAHHNGSTLRFGGVNGSTLHPAVVKSTTLRFGRTGGGIDSWKVGDAPAFRNPVRLVMTDWGVSTQTSTSSQTGIQAGTQTAFAAAGFRSGKTVGMPIAPSGTGGNAQPRRHRSPGGRGRPSPGAGGLGRTGRGDGGEDPHPWAPVAAPVLAPAPRPASRATAAATSSTVSTTPTSAPAAATSPAAPALGERQVVELVRKELRGALAPVLAARSQPDGGRDAHLADRVVSNLERRLLVERERRGL